jgi:hypothetical protein
MRRRVWRLPTIPSVGPITALTWAQLIAGSAALAELGLIDEYEFVVQPKLAGHGPTLFAGLSKLVDLRLVSRLESGPGRWRCGNKGLHAASMIAPALCGDGHHHCLRQKGSDFKRVIQRHRDVNRATIYLSMSYA